MNQATERIFSVVKASTIYSIGNFLNKAVLFLMVPLYSHFILPEDLYLNAILEPTEILLSGVLFLGLSQAFFPSPQAA